MIEFIVFFYAEQCMPGLALDLENHIFNEMCLHGVILIGYYDCIPYFLFSDDHLAYPQYRLLDKLHHSEFDPHSYFFVTVFHALPTTNINDSVFFFFKHYIPFRQIPSICFLYKTNPLQFNTRKVIEQRHETFDAFSCSFAYTFPFNHNDF